MKKFFKITFNFILLLLSFILFIDFLTSLQTKKKSNFTLVPKPKYIVVGHSHPECAFNDSLINKFKNLGQSGESYFYTYFKVKKILEQNISIETVFIEYTNNQITSEMNNWIWDNLSMSHRYPLYSSFMSLSNDYILIQHNPIGYINAFSLSIKIKINNIINKNYAFTSKYGGYMYLIRDKTDSILNHTNRLNFKNDINTNNSKDISESNLFYLHKTIELIRNQNKKVFLIRSPQHSKYRGYSNESTYKNILFNRFSDIEYLDFSKFPLSNSEFGDLEHINHKGAKTFSIWFNKLIENGLLFKPNKQEFINGNMRK